MGNLTKEQIQFMYNAIDKYVGGLNNAKMALDLAAQLQDQAKRLDAKDEEKD